jgi:hypothetical protein
MFCKESVCGEEKVTQCAKKSMFWHMITVKRGKNATEICPKRKVFRRILASHGSRRYNRDGKRGVS